jgi:hypothetical protein
VVASLFVSHTPIACFLMGGIYLAVMIPAALDAFQTASGRPRTFVADTAPYVIIMLILVGPFAIPLLWQSSKFSKTAKLGWTLGVILVTFFAIVLLMFAATFLDQILRLAKAV